MEVTLETKQELISTKFLQFMIQPKNCRKEEKVESYLTVYMQSLPCYLNNIYIPKMHPRKQFFSFKKRIVTLLNDTNWTFLGEKTFRLLSNFNT